MARLNFSSRDEFGFRDYGQPTSVNLLEMLQQATQVPGLLRQRPGYMPRPDASPADDSGTPPGGLLGRWLELQAVLQQPQLPNQDRGEMQSAPADPEIRRLVRVSPLGSPRGGAAASDRSLYSDLESGIPPVTFAMAEAEARIRSKASRQAAQRSLITTRFPLPADQRAHPPIKPVAEPALSLGQIRQARAVS